VHRLDVGQLFDVVEASAGMQVGLAGVFIVDRDGEKFEEAAYGVFAGSSDDRRHDRSARASGCGRRQRSGFGWHKVA
jgi:hypothetical protein